VIRAPVGRLWIANHLPHQGRMSLIDEIVEWDRVRLRAVARNHRAPDHPLRRGNELPIACGIEYGAQAAAAHGALVAEAASAPGFLASVRSVVFHARRLDDAAGDLEVRVEQLGASEAGVLYRFEVACAGGALVDGRLTVAFAR
jgi:predicted hotdog family 3-hydroxylacyl-ACP dehydratase